MVVEAEERLLCGGGGFMVWSWRPEVEDGQDGVDRLGRMVFIICSFLGGVESYFQSYPLQSYQK
jgi:hypothetical protein